MEYQLRYDGTNGYLALFSADTNGSSADADILRVPDGQLTVDGNSTFDDNAFDYVCETCGKHAYEQFFCHGRRAPWHDDVALMALAVRRDPDALARMKRLKLARVYDDGQLFVSMNRTPWFLMSGMGQMYKKMQKMERAMAAAGIALEDE